MSDNATAALLSRYAATLDAGESYASLARIRDVDDLPSMAIDVPHWSEDGKRCVLVVRALSHKEVRRVVKEGKDDGDLQNLWIARFAIKEPQGITDEHIAMLETKNPGAIAVIADVSTALGQYSAETIRQYTAALLGITTDEVEASRPA